MFDQDCKVGQLVICRHYSQYGQYGHISEVRRDSDGMIIVYTVTAIASNHIGVWTSLSSWDIVSAAMAALLSNPKVTVTDLQISKPISAECPCGIHRSRCDYHHE